MANRLKNLLITKVALCPKGQNPEADIVFYKSDESATPNALATALTKMLGGLTKATFNSIRADRQQMETVMEAWEETSDCLNDLRSALGSSILWDANAPNTADALKSIDQFKAAIDETLRSLSKEDNVKDYSKMSQEELINELKTRDAAPAPETVVKADLEVVQKALEAQAEELKKAKERADALENEAKVEKEKREKLEDIAKGKTTFPNLPLSDEEKGALVAQMRGMPEAAAKAFEKALNAGNTALKDVTKEVGADNAEPQTAREQLKTKAEELRKAKPDLTFAQAYDEACKANPELYIEARAEA